LSRPQPADFKRLGIGNATVEVGDGHLGWARHAPYDAHPAHRFGLPAVPAEMKAQLRVGGRLLAVVGEPPIMTAIFVTPVLPRVR
jgi:protein-L-isoaspartate(D-aspartate) O-methyltransferase